MVGTQTVIYWAGNILIALGISFYLSYDNLHLIEKAIIYLPFEKQGICMQTLKKPQINNLSIYEIYDSRFYLFLYHVFDTFFLYQSKLCNLDCFIFSFDKSDSLCWTLYWWYSL